jgi:hypothetical protein
MRVSEAIIRLANAAANNAFRFGVTRNRKLERIANKAQRASLHGIRKLAERMEAENAALKAEVLALEKVASWARRILNHPTDTDGMGGTILFKDLAGNDPDDNLNGLFESLAALEASHES